MTTLNVVTFQDSAVKFSDNAGLSSNLEIDSELFTHIHVQRHETLLGSTAFTATHHQNLAPWPKMIFDMDQKYLPVLFDSFFL